MNIVVCVKRVPATDTQIKVGSDGVTLDPAGVEFVLNPYDEIAVEEALKLKEATGDGSVTVVTLGSGDAQKELRTCLAMGADKAVLINAGDVQHDAFSTAETLAAQIKTMECDLVLCGKQAVDGDDNQIAGRLAALLEFAGVTEVKALELSDGVYTATRDIEGAQEIVRCKGPAIFSAQKGLNEPRYASLKGIMAAKRKPLEEVAATDAKPATTVASLSLPPARPDGRILGEGAAAVDALVDVLRNEAKVL